MPAWIGGGIALAGLVGDIFSSSGQSQTNAANIQVAQMQDEFNAQQAQINRDYQTQMSDTAMQRRVADLWKAGLNPLMAIGAGGASSPAGSAASAAGLPQMGNPNASFSNAGSIAASSLQTMAQVKNTEAQTELIKAQTPGNVITLKPDGTPDWFAQGNNGGYLGNYTAGNMFAENQRLDAITQNLKQNTEKQRQETGTEEYQRQLAGLQLGRVQQLNDWMVKQAIAEAKIDVARVAPAEAEAAVMGSSWGPAIKAAQSILGNSPVGSLLQLGGRLIGGFGGGGSLGGNYRGPPPGVTPYYLQR